MTTPDPSFDLPSPCKGICQLDQNEQYCLGCYRTVDEIQEWRFATNARRYEILQALKNRQPENMRQRRRTNPRRWRG